MQEHESTPDPARSHNARSDAVSDPGVVSPTDVNPVDGQRLGLPSYRDSWLGIDNASTPIPFEELVGHTHAYSGDPTPQAYEAFDLDSD
jgi:hypothetical protein